MAVVVQSLILTVRRLTNTSRSLTDEEDNYKRKAAHDADEDLAENHFR